MTAVCQESWIVPGSSNGDQPLGKKRFRAIGVLVELTGVRVAGMDFKTEGVSNQFRPEELSGDDGIAEYGSRPPDFVVITDY